MPLIRPARTDDAAAMVGILNDIIAQGGTTAHKRPFDTHQMLTHYLSPDNGVCCHVAEIDGRVSGFQSLTWPVDPADPMPSGWAIIASFVDGQAAGQGLGSALLDATCQAARSAHVTTIDATIRADNASGLRYYAAMGFADYDRLRDIPLHDGTSVDRIRKKLTV